MVTWIELWPACSWMYLACAGAVLLGLPYPIHDLRMTRWTVGVSEKAIGRIDAMCVSIRLLRDPAFMIKGSSGLVSNESTSYEMVRQLSPTDKLFSFAIMRNFRRNQSGARALFIIRP